MAVHPDHNIVQDVLKGQHHAFEEIITMTEGLVLSIVYKLISNPHQRKDVIQEVYLKAYKNLGKFQFRSKLSTWIGTIAYNTSVNHLNKNKTELGELDDQFISLDSTSDHVLNTERADILRREINRLTPVFKTIITLYHNQEMSYREISEITGLPDGTVKNYLFRARKKLKEQLLKQYKKEDL